MRIGSGLLPAAVASLLLSLAPQPQLQAQTQAVAAQSARTTPNPNSNEIPLQRCDRLPVVIVQVNDVNKRFLIDTAATGGGGGVDEEALVDVVYLDDYDGEAIAALQGDLVGIGVGRGSCGLCGDGLRLRLQLRLRGKREQQAGDGGR